MRAKTRSCRATASPYSPKRSRYPYLASPFSGGLCRPRSAGPVPLPSVVIGVGRSRTSLPRLRACPFPVSGWVVGVGRRVTAVRRSSPPCPCAPAPLVSLVRGVGRSRLGVVRRVGRGSPTHSRHGWPLGWAVMKTRSRRWQAPTSEARTLTHCASYPTVSRSASTAPSARIWLSGLSPTHHGHGSTSLSASALRSPLTFSATTRRGRMVSMAWSMCAHRPVRVPSRSPARAPAVDTSGHGKPPVSTSTRGADVQLIWVMSPRFGMPG